MSVSCVLSEGMPALSALVVDGLTLVYRPSLPSGVVCHVIAAFLTVLLHSRPLIIISLGQLGHPRLPMR